MIGMSVPAGTRPSAQEGAAQPPVPALLALKLEAGAPNLTSVPAPSYGTTPPNFVLQVNKSFTFQSDILNFIHEL